ncbi:MAG: hypothetical protein VKK04_05165 [Synechococcales bacterium]|nr:hypothetical protein [Synechococcales bacterium]
MLERFTSWGDRPQSRTILLGTSLFVLGACVRFLHLVAFNQLQFNNPENPAFLEAQSLLNGTIALPARVHDTAVFDGAARNIFQPGQTLYFLAHLGLGGTASLAYYQLELVAIALISALLLNIALLRLSGSKVIFSLSLTLSMMLGAPYFASFPSALGGSIYRANHCFSIVFLVAFLVLISSKLTATRLGWIGACIGAAMLFRAQYVLLLLLPVLLLLQDDEGQRWDLKANLGNPSQRRELLKKIGCLVIAPALALLLILGFQAARFNNPLENGYLLAYEGREDYIADRAQDHGILSEYFLPENLYRTFWAAPELDFDGWEIEGVKGDRRGNSLIFSQPILLMALLIWPSLRNPRVQAWAIASLVLALPVWLYHNPGVYAPGYMRLSLDYIMLWAGALAVGVQRATVPRPLLWLTVPAALWAMFYASLLIPT